MIRKITPVPEDFDPNEFILSKLDHLFSTAYKPSNTLGVKFNNYRQIWQTFLFDGNKDVLVGEFDTKQKAVIAMYWAECNSGDPYFLSHSTAAIFIKEVIKRTTRNRT